MTRFGCNLRRIASLRRLSAGRGAPHAAGWPAAPPWPHPHRVRVVVAVGSGLMRVPESGVGSPFRSATSACLAVCLCRWCWWWVTESRVAYRFGVIALRWCLLAGVYSGACLFGIRPQPRAARRRTSRHRTLSNEAKAKPHRGAIRLLFGYTSLEVTTAADRKANQLLTLLEPCTRL